jgi:hypothetical protein
MSNSVFSGYCVVIDGTPNTSNVVKFVSGVRTNLCTSTGNDGFVSGDTLELSVSGTTVTYTHNSSSVPGCTAFTDSTFSSGYPGMVGYNNGSNPTVTLFSADCLPTCAAASGGGGFGGKAGIGGKGGFGFMPSIWKRRCELYF